MHPAITPTGIQAVVRHLYRPPAWLGPGEYIEFKVDTEYDGDRMVIRASLRSPNEWREGKYAEGHIAGQLLRAAAYREQTLVPIVEEILAEVVTKLGAYDECNDLLELANQSWPGSEGLEVLVDALLERQLIAPLPVPTIRFATLDRLVPIASAGYVRKGLETAALVIARQMLAPFIFGGWTTTPWPLIAASRSTFYSSVTNPRFIDSAGFEPRFVGFDSTEDGL